MDIENLQKQPTTQVQAVSSPDILHTCAVLIEEIEWRQEKEEVENVQWRCGGGCTMNFEVVDSVEGHFFCCCFDWTAGSFLDAA